MNRCMHCGLNLTRTDQHGPKHDTVDCARRVALAGRSDIVCTLRRHFDQEGDTARAHERAEGLVAYWEQRTAGYLSAAIDGLELDDHWATMYDAEAVRQLPALIAQPSVPDGTIRVLNANGDVCIEQPPKEQP